MSTKFLNISTDNTLGGNSPSDSTVVSQKAIKEYVDTHTTSGANTSLSNLTSTGKNISTWSNNVTNCITYIPQDIKLELNNGTLTLKAGSKLYVPNGDGVFDIRNITADQTYTQTTNGQYLLMARQDMSIWGDLTSNATSGTTPPAGTGTFYNITTNSIDWYSSGTYNERHYSFPFALITVSNGAISSIDQIFNGFGYIGSTVFALPGIKMLMPEYRNADGTLKNYEKTLDSVLVDISLTGTGLYYYNILWSGYIGKHQVTAERYNKSRNTLVWGDADNTACIIAVAVCDHGKIISFAPKTVFHAVDYSDTEFIGHQAMPSGTYRNLGSLGASGSHYTAPADGYFSIHITQASSNTYFNAYVNIGGAFAYAVTLHAGTLVGYNQGGVVPVPKGADMEIVYNGTPSVNTFQFVYAQGAQ